MYRRDIGWGCLKTMCRITVWNGQILIACGAILCGSFVLESENGEPPSALLVVAIAVAAVDALSQPGCRRAFSVGCAVVLSWHGIAISASHSEQPQYVWSSHAAGVVLMFVWDRGAISYTGVHVARRLVWSIAVWGTALIGGTAAAASNHWLICRNASVRSVHPPQSSLPHRGTTESKDS